MRIEITPGTPSTPYADVRGTDPDGHERHERVMLGECIHWAGEVRRVDIVGSLDAAMEKTCQPNPAQSPST